MCTFRICWLAATMMLAAAQITFAQATLADLRLTYSSLGKTPHDDSLRVDLLMQMAHQYSRTSIDSSTECINDAIRLSKKIGYTRGYATAINGLAMIDNMQGRLEKALEGYKEALGIFSNTHNINGQVGCLSNIGALYADAGLKELAIPQYLRAIALMNAYDSTNLNLGIVCLNLGKLYMNDDATFAQAEPYLETAVRNAGCNDDYSFKISAYLNYGKYVKRLGRATESVGLGLKALQIARDQEDLHGIAECYAYLTEVYVQKNEYDKALQYLQESESFFIKIDNKTKIIETKQQKGDILTLSGKYAEALKVYKELQSLLLKYGIPAQILKGYENLAKTYEALGDTKTAMQYHAKARGEE